MGKNPRVKMDSLESFQHFIKLPTHLMNFLAEWIHIEISQLLILKQIAQNNRAYIQFDQPKGKSGKVRTLSAPCPVLKKIQQHINNLIMLHIPVHKATYGCRIGCSNLELARSFSGFTKSMYKLDLIQAFPSVSRHRAWSNLNKPINFQLHKDGSGLKAEEMHMLADAVIDLVIYCDILPQGAPSSPTVFNICCGKMDRLLTEYLLSHTRKTGTLYRYGRYVDDLNFACEKPDGFSDEMRREIKNIIRKECGFSVHKKSDNTKVSKELYVPQVGGQLVTELCGIRLHQEPGKLTLAKETLSRYRTRLDAIKKRIQTGEKIDSQMMGEARGMIGYVKAVYSGRDIPSAVAKLIPEVIAGLTENR